MKLWENATFAERVKKGLEDALAFYEGKLSLATTELPDPPPKPGPRQIARLRAKLKMSQGVFAGVMNVSVRTVQSWEQGQREPSNAALRMLQVIDRQPEVIGMILPHRGVSTGRPGCRPPQAKRLAGRD